MNENGEKDGHHDVDCVGSGRNRVGDRSDRVCKLGGVQMTQDEAIAILALLVLWTPMVGFICYTIGHVKGYGKAMGYATGKIDELRRGP